MLFFSLNTELGVDALQPRSGIPLLRRSFLLPLAAAAVAALFTSCGSPRRSRVAQWESRYNDAALTQVTPAQLLNEANVHVDLIPAGKAGRYKYRPMTP